MKFFDFLKYDEDLTLQKKTVVILRWIALVGQLITIYVVHFLLELNLPIILCSITIFCGGLTNIFIQFSLKKNQLSNIESTILLFYDVIQLAVLIYLTGGVTNPFVIFLVVPAIVSSTLLNLTSTFFLSFITIVALVLLTFNYFPLPNEGSIHFHVPDYYLYSIPISLIIVLLFLNYFGFRFGHEARKRGDALNKLESVLAKEQELDSIGHQAAAAAHSLGTPLATISVVAKELKKEIGDNNELSKDIDLLISQSKRCSEILKRISKKQIEEDKFFSSTKLENLLEEIINSFKETSSKEIVLVSNNDKNKIDIQRSAEMIYGLRNFIGNAIKFSKSKVNIFLMSDEKEIKIIVNDDGPGFPKDIIAKLGEPYIKSRSLELNSNSGLGLGTFLGKTLLERQNAKLLFKEDKNLGGASVVISWSPKNILI